MPEKAKRLALLPETLRELFLKSGNLCAFAGCAHLMMDASGKFIGQICHIEAAGEGGERFNPNMTNEQRRGFANLMLMCYAHHVETNDVKAYPTEKLREMKADHERRFAHPDRAILETLSDWTETDEPTTIKNLRRMNTVLKWGHEQYQLDETANELNAYVAEFRNVPIELRRFVGAVAKRAVKIMKTAAVRDDQWGTEVLASDLQGALRLSLKAIGDRARLLEAYGLGDMTEFFHGDSRPEHAVRIRALKSGWRPWIDIVNFCNAESISIEVFTDDLDFARLDEA